ncbi:hypothetical protein [Corynebacterium lactis]|uniref:Uncharacterized protein n=1 Tax=Corynebacterium lactis RW2-5 TaxID=1408189 RepID=A0A0K2H3D5_9CORY|nr:hypothetical protein [Corynebacterium lactis]ALA68560.1 hypothetical protein CLAC_07380 [Corynebacterium lactis RW2-5]
MTSVEYLDALGRERLGRMLHSLEVMAPYLDAALVARPRGDEATPGRCSGAPGSSPPLSVPVLDVKYEAEQSVCGWACNLATDCGYPPPEVMGIASCAAWLHERVHDVAGMPWAVDCLDELCGQVSCVDAVVNPAQSVEVVASPLPERGSARQVAEALALLGIPISHTSLRRLAKRGVLTAERRADGVDEFNLAECKAYAVKWHRDNRDVANGPAASEQTAQKSQTA